MTRTKVLEKNYGGIGVVIGHEIPMPLTPMVPIMMRTVTCIIGGQKQIVKLSTRGIKAFEDQWNGLEIYGTKVNGKLTVTENVADAGGLSSHTPSAQNRYDKT